MSEQYMAGDMFRQMRELKIHAAREAVVEAAKEWHARPSIEQAVKDKTIRDTVERYKAVTAKLDAAAARLLEVESEHG